MLERLATSQLVEFSSFMGSKLCIISFQCSAQSGDNLSLASGGYQIDPIWQEPSCARENRHHGVLKMNVEISH